MSRPAAAAFAGLLLLAGCPIPQAVPDYPPGSITPPRILMDQLPFANRTIIEVAGDCAERGQQDPTFQMSATLDDVNTIESVVARWFVNYNPEREAWYRTAGESEIPGSGAVDGPTLRSVPTWTFNPFGGYHTATDREFGDPRFDGELQVVELVVSNGFSASATALPNRTAAPGFETQVYRWMFMTKNGASLPCGPQQPSP